MSAPFGSRDAQLPFVGVDVLPFQSDHLPAALTLALLSSATAMVRSGVALHRVDSVVPYPSSMMVWMTQLPAQRCATRDEQVAVYRRVHERLAALPGAAAARIATALPFYSAPISTVEVQNTSSTSAGGAASACVVAVSPPYFHTLGVRLLAGRMFDESDGTSGHEVAIVNERFAWTHFRETHPLRQVIRLQNSDPASTERPWRCSTA